jgi:hypothetical protein
MKTMIILGGDKISASASRIPELNSSDVLLVVDKSTSIKRVLRLIVRRRLSLTLFSKMLLCEIRRPTDIANIRPLLELYSNKDLLSAIDRYKPSQIILFRAGLIINREVISREVPLLNIHCARVPEYGGIGSIQRALNDGAFNQCATLHQVTTTIDQGLVFDEEPYSLDPAKSYCKNENIAYSAGILLLRRWLSMGPVMKGVE